MASEYVGTFKQNETNNDNQGRNDIIVDTINIQSKKVLYY